MSLFSKSDRRGLILLEWLAVLALVVLWAYTNKKEPGTSDDDSKGKKDSLYHERRAPRTYTYSVPETPVESFPFDPNTADSTTLLRLGLAPWQVQAVYRYRAKHGRYHTADDFKRLPGMTQELWDRLGKHVTIDPKYRLLNVPPKKTDYSPSRSSSQEKGENARPLTLSPDTPEKKTEKIRDTLQYPVKFEELTLVDINTADTNLLKKIPNIGSYRARKIVGYRQRLGGFANVEQVMEACDMPDEVLEWFSLVPVPLKTMDANRLSVRQFMRHPYLSFYQARDLVEYRKKHRSIQQIEELLSLESFSTADIERLRPYLIFR